MKKITTLVLVLTLAVSAYADTWWVGGVLYGNVCRYGYYYTVYPTSMGQPVGTSCPVRNNAGYIVATGVVTNE